MPRITPKVKLAESVIEEIKRMLTNGELREGDKLPNQNVFAEQLGVSRLSLREALHTLQLIGVIEQKPRVGTIIKLGNPDLWVGQMMPPLLSDIQSTLELIEARKVLEISISKLAVQRITDNEIKEIELCVHKMEYAYQHNELDNYLSADIAFHTSIAKASANRYLINMFLSIFKIMDQFIKEFFEIMPKSIDDSLRMHKLIVQSLKQKDEHKMIHYIKLHLETIENSLTGFYASK